MGGTLTLGLIESDVPADINTLQTDVAALQASGAIYDINLYNYTAVSTSGPTVMTDAQVRCPFIIVSSSDPADILYWPTSAEGTWPLNQKVSLLSSSNGVYIASESGGSSVYLEKGSIYDVAIIPSIAINVSSYEAVFFRGGHNGYLLKTATFTIDDTMAGKYIHLDSTTAAAIDIPAWLLTRNLKITIANGNTETWPFQAALGVTITSLTADGTSLPQNACVTLVRDGISNDYYLFPS